MTRALSFAIPLSLMLWGIAWYAPGVLIAIGGGAFLAVAYDIAMDW